MKAPSTREVTQLLRAWSEGDSCALEKLTPLVYEELHRAAHRHMAREQPDHILQTTALINEVYLRLVDLRDVSWQHRAQLFGSLRATDAAHSHRCCPLAAIPEARG